MDKKPLFWVGSSLEDLRAFPEDARRMAGHCLHLVQQGLEPPDRKTIGSVGPGVYEIRIHTKLEHRVFYVAKFTEGIYVLHAFQKKTRKAPVAELELGRRRLKQVFQERSGQNTK